MSENRKLYRDKDTLEYLYQEKGLTLMEVGERLGCSDYCVKEWMEKYNLERRDDNTERACEARRVNRATFATDTSGYEISKARYEYETDIIQIHRLVAVAENGIDAVKDMVVHHKNNISWDNRPENLEIMTDSEHKKLHGKERVRVEGGFK